MRASISSVFLSALLALTQANASMAWPSTEINGRRV